MESKSAIGVWTTEPLYDPPFQAEPTEIEHFLDYLAKRGKVKVTVECHSLVRREKEGYVVNNTEKVGFRMKSVQSPLATSARRSLRVCRLKT